MLLVAIGLWRRRMFGYSPIKEVGSMVGSARGPGFNRID